MPRLDRLRRLANGLRNPKLVPPPHFDMQHMAIGNLATLECGSAGCALGFCPRIFGPPWRYANTASGVVFGDAETDRERAHPLNAAAYFFDLPVEEVARLFYLTDDTLMRDEWHHPERTAERIDRFCDQVERCR